MLYSDLYRLHLRFDESIQTSVSPPTTSGRLPIFDPFMCLLFSRIIQCSGLAIHQSYAHHITLGSNHFCQPPRDPSWCRPNRGIERATHCSLFISATGLLSAAQSAPALIQLTIEFSLAYRVHTVTLTPLRAYARLHLEIMPPC